MKIKLLFLIFLVSYTCIAQINKEGEVDSLLQTRKDSIAALPNINRHLPVSARYYIVDSIVIVNDIQLHKFTRHSDGEMLVSLIEHENYIETFNLVTSKKFIVNNKLLDSFAMLKLYACKSLRVRKISSQKLKEKFNINNEQGAFVIKCL